MEPINWHEAEDATLKALPKTIAEAEAGDPNAKRRLLDIFCAMVDANETPYPELLSYLSRQISAALIGGYATKELGKTLLGGPAHRRAAPETAFIHETVAWRVAELRASGMSREDAVSQTAEDLQELGLDDDAVLRAYKDCSKRADFKRLEKLLLPDKPKKQGSGSSRLRTPHQKP